jgi:hypothetical protein
MFNGAVTNYCGIQHNPSGYNTRYLLIWLNY